ncbi:unnamed protein product [Allacma fusca]|uniref:Uncharacterized protein n=1 Tax=Allacma fusca TaxID=39272 RepID=A0A8J2K4T2_9HEXA|nr:unnamed protein product [Allacma fusca]
MKEDDHPEKSVTAKPLDTVPAYMRLASKISRDFIRSNFQSAESIKDSLLEISHLSWLDFVLTINQTEEKYFRICSASPSRS